MAVAESELPRPLLSWPATTKFIAVCSCRASTLSPLSRERVAEWCAGHLERSSTCTVTVAAVMGTVRHEVRPQVLWDLPPSPQIEQAES